MTPQVGCRKCWWKPANISNWRRRILRITSNLHEYIQFFPWSWTIYRLSTMVTVVTHDHLVTDGADWPHSRLSWPLRAGARRHQMTGQAPPSPCQPPRVVRTPAGNGHCHWSPAVSITFSQTPYKLGVVSKFCKLQKRTALKGGGWCFGYWGENKLFLSETDRICRCCCMLWWTHHVNSIQQILVMCSEA